MAELINKSKSQNYVMSDKSIYILDDFRKDTMNELIGIISTMIRELPSAPTYNATTKIISPYETEDIKNPIIDIFIDSNGGDTNMLNNLSTLLNFAKARGAIIRTTVLSRAYSCGSLLAIQGTPGFRIMSHAAEHMIHFGSLGLYAESEKMVLHLIERQLERKRLTHDKYKTYTKIPHNKLEDLSKTEGEIWDAEECLEYSLCDWILGENGILTSRNSR